MANYITLESIDNAVVRLDEDFSIKGTCDAQHQLQCFYSWTKRGAGDHHEEPKAAMSAAKCDDLNT